MIESFNLWIEVNNLAFNYKLNSKKTNKKTTKNNNNKNKCKISPLDQISSFIIQPFSFANRGMLVKLHEFT